MDVTVEIRVAWWWQFYASGVAAVAAIFDLEPDYEKVQSMALRACRWRFVGARTWQRFA